MRSQPKFSDVLKKLLSSDVYVSIDDLTLTITAKATNAKCFRHYPIDRIPIDVLREIHSERET